MADLLQQFETEERLGSARPRTQPLNPFEEAEVTLQQTVRGREGGCMCGGGGSNHSCSESCFCSELKLFAEVFTIIMSSGGNYRLPQFDF